MISKNQIKFIRQLEQKKFRKREGLFVAEGPKVVGDLMHRLQPRAIFATQEWLDNYNPSIVPIPAVAPTRSLSAQRDASLADISHSSFLIPHFSIVNSSELQRISFLQHPQQVLALFPLPDPTLTSHLSPLTSHLSLALDGIQDPGNLGTIIRIADWFGIDTIYCSPDTADAYAPKVVQATMGSLARVHIIYTDLPALLDALPPTYPVYGTLLDGQDIYAQQLTPEGIIVMGNEGNGISAPVRQRVNRPLLIPCFRQGDSAESLNVAVATAITCSEFRRTQAR